MFHCCGYLNGSLSNVILKSAHYFLFLKFIYEVRRSQEWGMFGDGKDQEEGVVEGDVFIGERAPLHCQSSYELGEWVCDTTPKFLVRGVHSRGEVI